MFQLTEFEKLFVEFKSKKYTNASAYLEASKAFKRKVSYGTSKVNGSRLASKLNVEIEEAIKLNAAKAEIDNVSQRVVYANKVREATIKEKIAFKDKEEQRAKHKTKKKEKDLPKENAQTPIFEEVKGFLVNRTGVLNARSVLFQRGMEEFEWASPTESPAYKASMFKSLVDLVKLEAPENVDLTKIDYDKPAQEIFKDVMLTLGSTPSTINVFLKGFSEIMKKEISEMKEGNAILKELEK